MTNICYSLEEAAEKLKFSETVLVRLSQYLKVPQSAYEEAGYLSFKGDLAFSEQDLAFFAQVKERLLLGESLDEVKNRLPHQMAAIDTDVPSVPTLPPSPLAVEEAAQKPEVLGGVSSTLPGELPPMREIQDRQPYEKAAEKSFERYKSMHRSGIGKVFENMLKEVGAPQPARRAEAATPAFKPMRTKPADQKTEDMAAENPLPPRREDAGMPFGRWAGSQPASPEPALTQPAALKSGIAASGMSQPAPARPVPSQAVWEPLIQQAAQKPRSLNIHLKNAAILVRERALGQAPQQELL